MKKAAINNDIKAYDQVITDKYAIYHGDSCEIIKALPDNKLHFGLHSPPFEGLYKFSNDPRDISNNDGDSFWKHYSFLINELLRITMPGRLHAVHCMQLPTSKTRDGYIGMRDFRGEIIRAYQDAGWIFHSETCIRKDPVVAQQRTKSLRLLHKQIEKDSAMSGQALADYIVVFRKPGDNPEKVAGRMTEYVGEGNEPENIESRVGKPMTDYDGNIIGYATQDHAEKWYSIEVWQRYAEPVWMDINQTRTLQYRGGRDEKDEQHISPLQLDVIERCIHLWTNPGDIVFTPFLGIGSEVYGAVEMDRYGIGIELKQSYFNQAVKNLEHADRRRKDGNLFTVAAE